MNQNKKSIVLVAGMLFNISIGVIYAWGVFKTPLGVQEGWSDAQQALPYSVGIFFWAIGNLIGGKVQDKIGPTIVLRIGGILVGLGLILSSLVISTPTAVVVTFGVVTGLGIGFGYGCVAPSCLKWYHGSKKGMIGGLVVGAFGCGAVFFAPVTQALLNSHSVSETMQYIGMGIIVVTLFASLFIKNPPADYIIEVPAHLKINKENEASIKSINCFTLKEMVKTPQFFLTGGIYFFGASVGLLVIPNIKKIFELQVGLNAIITGTSMVAILAVFNTLGRVLAGAISDKIGRNNTLLITAILQILVMLIFTQLSSLPLFIFGTAFVGYAYGSYLSVIPVLTADNYGLKNYGGNYGVTYLFWGFAGLVAPIIASNLITDNGTNFSNVYLYGAISTGIALIIGLILKKVGPVKPNKNV